MKILSIIPAQFTVLQVSVHSSLHSNVVLEDLCYFGTGSLALRTNCTVGIGGEEELPRELKKCSGAYTRERIIEMLRAEQEFRQTQHEVMGGQRVQKA